jgi:LL-diaminopimelate aminotransferase
MPRINDHFLKLKAGYLFPEIGRRVTQFTDSHPEAAEDLIRCGIGDVTEPLPEACRNAIHEAIDELGTRQSFHGYGPEQGYAFLREAIVDHQFPGIGIDADEIFISDGAKCDTGNILDIFGPGNRIAITDPVYPVYVDTNVMAGNTGDCDREGKYQGLLYLPCTSANQFVPEIPANEKIDLIYLCYPNNPTGEAISREQLTAWVTYARKNDSIILYDAAYEAFIQESDLPRSIFEIDGARDCAIEFRSFSKNAGFTGVRCAYTIIPKNLTGKTATGMQEAIHPLWLRRQSTKFNGASYPVQRGAEAVFSRKGRVQVKELTDYYMNNASLLRTACQTAELEVYGGINSPYVWVACPEGVDSWAMFDLMLEKAHVVITPGAGFGAAGEGYFRISAFNSLENVEEVCRRIVRHLG